MKRAARPQREIGGRRSQSLLFRLFPKLDVVGSSPIARSVKLSDKHLLNWPADLGWPFSRLERKPKRRPTDRALLSVERTNQRRSHGSHCWRVVSNAPS